MYQVMLVDDEYYVRKSIQKRVNWAALDCVIAAEADNGSTALELVGELKPDIVLVDIMMPEMDGLELIRRAREISPHTQFAILSGYDDFSYTKEAIKLKVIDYIKKPVDAAELEKTVREMIRQIDASSQARQHYTELVDQAKNLTEMKIDRALNDVCSSAEAYLSLEKHLPAETYAWIIVFTAATSPASETPAQEQLKTDIERFLERSFTGKCHVVNNETDANEIRILLPVSSFNTVNTVQQAAEDLFRFLDAHPSIAKKKQVSLAYSKPAPLRGLHEQYGESLGILKCKIFQGQHGVQYADRLKAPAQDEISTVFSLLESIKRCIAARQFNQLEHILSQLFSEKLITSPRVLEDAMFYLYGLSREYAVRYNATLPEQYAQRMTGSHALLYHDSLQSVKAEIRDLMVMFFCDGCPIDDEQITTQVKKYIEENYHQKISLTSIAGLFYLNASYLSSLFKRKTGVNLNKYIETVRIDQAKKLLSSLDVTVNDIATMIGYGDPNYFTKAFKKRTGKTPLEYKALSRKK